MKLFFYAAVLIITLSASGYDNSPAPSLSTSSYPQWILQIMKWVPPWKPTDRYSDRCLAALNSSQQIDPHLCEVKDESLFFDSYRKKIFFDYDVSEDRGFQKINIHLSDQVTIRGLLALHKNKKKPLIIFRMGIHGNRDEPLAEKYLLKLLFEDLGYHILVLESLTSHGHIVTNKSISAGGFEEGLHTYAVLEKIRNKEWLWVNQITDIHLVALSMGGLGAFLTVYLDEAKYHQIKSALFLCPLMNFKETHDRLSEPNFKNVIIDIWNSQRLKSLADKNPLLKDITPLKILLEEKPLFGPAVMKWLQLEARTPRLMVNDLPMAAKKHIEDSQTMYDLNNFWPIFKNEKTPLSIVITNNDPLVVPELNAKKIINQTQSGTFKKTTVEELNGMHCSLAENYEWPFLMNYFRTHLERR